MLETLTAVRPMLSPMGPDGLYCAQRHIAIEDVSGEVVADLGIAPPVMVGWAMTSLRKAAPMPIDARVRAIAQAGALFATGMPGGLSIAEHERLVSRVGGIPAPVVRAATQVLAQRTAQIFASIEHARPAGAVIDWRHPLTRTGRGVWARRGNVLSVHAAGNHPGTHTIWPEALAFGYRVAIRPSRREPFTPFRLVAALREAGFGDDQVMLLPSEHDAAQAMLRGADLAYGSDEIIRQYANDPKVLSLRPGRSKILVTASVDWRAHLDLIVDSISHHGGTGCVNATAVLVEGDATPLARALTERLSTLPNLPPEHEHAALPVQPLGAARTLAKHVEAKAAGARAWLGGKDLLHDLGDGSAVLRPAVHQLADPNAEALGTELPFPCVWVAPWSRQDGLAPLRDTLVLTVLTDDPNLIDALVEEPTISNVHIGDHPTYWTGTGMPHDGYLADFLMRAKTVIRG
ncbi:aldehyde dehydrogenase (plasmid) [Burkholderia ubonensis]|uniref:Aldehyde dehydrogenase n=1 Tax=Burkholderia ubonensis TaxID=101571 RepID=A0A103R180_9BURK|nr:aldehyde dehydrogenase family protein [Burkholderia ubonensis]AOJ64622.1 aldehyde dehydrogenase [Burkholderia ubonensis]KVG59354.1 aldehyde dehydrogenase [Burkholderia ubonensis]